MYHYIKPENTHPSALHWLGLNKFEEQLNQMLEVGKIIHPLQLMDENYIPQPNHFLLTFDDGLSDHYNHVFPILKKYEITGLFFINGLQYEAQRLLNVHRIHYLLHQHYSVRLLNAIEDLILACKQDESLVLFFGNQLYNNMSEKNENINTIKKLINFYLTPAKQDEVASALLNDFLPSSEAQLMQEWYLSPAQITDMATAGMMFGAHGYSHTVLTNLSNEQQHNDISLSIKIAGQLAQQHIQFFCYPYGYSSSFNFVSQDVLLNNKIKYAFSVENAPIERDTLIHNPYRLTRIDCNQFSAA